MNRLEILSLFFLHYHVSRRSWNFVTYDSNDQNDKYATSCIQENPCTIFEPMQYNIWTMLWTCHAISWVHGGVSHTPLEICRGSDLLLIVSKPAAIPTVPNFCCLESNNNSASLFTIEDFHTVCMFQSKPRMVSFYFDLWRSHYTLMPS